MRIRLKSAPCKDAQYSCVLTQADMENKMNVGHLWQAFINPTKMEQPLKTHLMKLYPRNS
jgi:hypothetical protein